MKQLLFLFLMLLVSNFIANCQTPKIRIDPSHAFGGTVSEYFESVEYVPLETKKESLFGDISRLFITDSSLIILDDDTKNVLFFDLHGKFLTKIKYLNESSPIVFPLQKNKLIQVSFFNKATSRLKHFYYTYKGVKVDKAPPTLINNSALVFLDENHSVLLNDCYSVPKEKQDKDSFYLLSVYENDKLYKSLVPYTDSIHNTYCYLYPNLISISNPNSENFCYLVDFDRNIYKINKDGADLLFKIVFPADRLFPNDISKYKDLSRDEFRKIFQSSQPKIIDYLYNINISGNYLMFKIAPLNIRLLWQDGSAPEAQSNFFYNLKSTKLVSYERIQSDSNSYYLPISDGARTRFTGLTYSGKFVYSTVSSLKMFAARDATKSKTPKYPSGLQEYFKSQTRKSNPVVVRMKVKES